MSIQEKDQCKNEKPKLTSKQYFVLVLCTLGFLFTTSSYSLIAPFFPKHAEQRGATPTQYGFIFAVYELIQFATAPIMSTLIPKLSIKFCICIGLIICGYCHVVFGLLRWCPPGTTYITIAFMVRSLTAIGSSAFFPAGHTTTAVYFPHHKAQVFALFQLCWGMGAIIGPAVGGVLYDLGGFNLPFNLLGSLTFILGIISFFIFPDIKFQGSSKSVGVLKVLSNIDMTLNYILLTMAAALFGFNDATLEHHLREFTVMSSTETGGIFLLGGLTYGVASQIAGYIGSRVKNLQNIAISGIPFTIMAFVISGPIYGLPFQPSVILVIIAQILYGIGVGGLFNGPYLDCLDMAKEIYGDDSASATISALFTGTVALGASIGPAVGGIMIDTIGYRKACLVVVSVQILILATVLIRAHYRYKPKDVKMKENISTRL